MQKIDAQQQHLTFPSWLQKQVFQFSEKIRQAQVHEGAGFDKHTDNIGDMVRLLPKFNEKDPDVFFSLFESVAEERGGVTQTLLHWFRVFYHLKISMLI